MQERPMQNILLAITLHVFCNVNCKAQGSSGDNVDIANFIISSLLNESPVVIYETYYERRAEDVFTMMDLNRTQLLYDQLSFLPFLEQHMKNIITVPSLEEMKRYLHFVVFCNTSCILDVLTKVVQLDKAVGQGSLLRHFSTWLVVSPDDPQPTDLHLDNIAWVRLETDEMHCTHINTRTGIENILGKYCLNRKDISLKYMRERTLHTLLWTPGHRQWSPVCWLDLTHQKLFDALYPNTKRGLNGRELQLLALEWSHFTKRTVTNGTVTFEGASIDVVKMLGNCFNFSFCIKEPGDGSWGTEMENGSWTGMIGALQRSEADLIPVPYVIEANRKRVVDFSPVTLASRYHIIYQGEAYTTFSWFYFLSCFKVEVYVCIIVSLLWILFLGIFVKRHLGSKNQATACDVVDVGFRAVLRQDIMSFSSNNSLRILIWTWCVFCLLTSVCYTANLVAFATVEKHKRPFRNLQELAETDYKIYYHGENYLETLFKVSDDPIIRQLAGKSLPLKFEGGGLRIDLVAELLREGNNVFVGASVTVGTIKLKSCDFEVLPERVLQTSSALPFQRRSPLQKLFRNKIQQLKDMGVIDKAEKMWTPAAKPCQSQQQTLVFPLELLKPVLIVCAVGVLLAFLVLMMEIFGKTRVLFSCLHKKSMV